MGQAEVLLELGIGYRDDPIVLIPEQQGLCRGDLPEGSVRRQRLPLSLPGLAADERALPRYEIDRLGLGEAPARGDAMVREAQAAAVGLPVDAAATEV